MLINLKAKYISYLKNIFITIISIALFINFINSFVNSFNPYAEESVIFIDSLKLPFIESIKELDFGYPTIPMHLIWRISWILSLYNLKLTIILVRIISIFLISYSLGRSFYIISKIKKIKFSNEVLFAYFVLFILFISRIDYVLYSFQVSYSFIPLLISIICRDFVNLKNIYDKDNKYLSSYRSSNFKYLALDNLFVIFCCLNKPLLWIFCFIILLSNLYILKKFKNIRKEEKFLRRVTVFLIFISFVLTFTLVINNYLTPNFESFPSDMDMLNKTNIDLLSKNESIYSLYNKVFVDGYILLVRIIKTTLTVSLLSLPTIIFCINKKRPIYKSNIFLYTFAPVIALEILLFSLIGYMRFFLYLKDISVLIPSILISYIFFRSRVPIKFVNIIFYKSKLIRYLAFLFLTTPWLIFGYINFKNPFNKYFQQSYQSNYFEQNDNKLELDSQRCYYPGPGKWNGPYILNHKKNCLVKYLSTERKISEEIIIDDYKNIKNIDSLIFELSANNNEPGLLFCWDPESHNKCDSRKFFKNIYSYKLYTKSENKVNINEEFLFSGRIYPTKTIYQHKLSYGFKPSYIYIRLYDQFGREVKANNFNVKIGLIFTIDYPRIKYSSKENNLQARIKKYYQEFKN